MALESVGFAWERIAWEFHCQGRNPWISAVWSLLSAILDVIFPLRALIDGIVSIQGWTGCFSSTGAMWRWTPQTVIQQTSPSLASSSINPPNSFDKTNPPVPGFGSSGCFSRVALSA
jgi:hypothetical protein